ncbi:MAG TPA: class D sortase [Candidatus Dormibacteraeota bacterium]
MDHALLARPRVERRPRAAHLLGRLFTIAGLLVLIVFFGDIALGAWQQRQLDATLHRQLATTPAALAPAPVQAKIQPFPVDGVDFGIEVPKIGYSAAVAEGTDSKTLDAGPGHYSDTAWPGQSGDIGVAAHNVYWIKFDELQPGDSVLLRTRWGTYSYVIDSRRIVWPDDRTILIPTAYPRLTLTTCWPLWAGAFANQRLVFIAHQSDPPLTGR